MKRLRGHRMLTPDDLQFKELVLSNKLATPEQAEDCEKALETYETAGIKKPISTIFLDKGYMTLKQINAVHQLQGKDEQYIIRGYTILETLGQGGLGIVYKARQDSIGRIVALKIMFPNLTTNKEYVQRFMREAKVSAQLDHPNIVRGIDFGESEAYYFFAMEFVDGKSIKDMMNEQYNFSEKDAATIILKVAKALRYGEEHNLVHRDIKPDNIMIAKDGTPKLCDLGLAKLQDTDMSLTRTGVVVGTPHYISPEQAVGQRDLDIRSDIYSLGVTFYHMVTGDVPYRGSTVVSIISQHLSGTIPSPKEKNPELSPEICKIICKMMNKKRENRYQTTQELIVDLNRFLRGQEPLVEDKPVTKIKSGSTTAVDQQVREESDISGDMVEFIQAATISMQEDTTSAAIHEAMEREKQLQKSTIGDTEQIQETIKTEEASPKPSESLKLVETLEKKIESEKIQKSKGVFRKIAMFLLIMGGLGYLGYINQDRIIQIFNKPKVPIPIVDIDDYQSGQYAKEQREKFEENNESIKPLVLDPEMKEKNMVFIEGGTFRMGSNFGDQDEKVTKKNVDSYYMDKYEVSNAEFEAFCNKTGYGFPKINRRERAWEELPVTNVTFYDASLYAKWMGKTLPTEAQWEYAIKTERNFEYPWGQIFKKGLANVETGHPKVVKGYQQGKTKTGLYNMIGNVWEWTCTPYDQNGKNFIIKGGSYLYPKFFARASYKDGLFPHGKRKDVGFRCVLKK